MQLPTTDDPKVIFYKKHAIDFYSLIWLVDETPNSLFSQDYMILNSLCKIWSTAILYFEIISLILTRKKWIPSSAATSTNVIVLATDFLPTIHGGIYRPASWLKLATENKVALQLATNNARRIDTFGEVFFEQLNIKQQIEYFDENKFNIVSKACRLLLSRPEFFLAALEKLEQLHQQNPISHIIASGPDFTSFAAATLFAKKHNISLHLDYRDEWTLSPFEFAEKTVFSSMIEKACVNLAHSISMTTQSQLNNFNQHFKLGCEPWLIPNGCDHFPELPQIKISDTNQIHICHSGNIGGHNDLTELLDYLNLINQEITSSGYSICLDLCGNISATQKVVIENINYFPINKLGQLSPEQAFMHVITADVCLLLIDSRYERYLPGKIFSYIATGRPILIFGTSFSHEISALCQEFAVPHFFANSRAGSIQSCCEFLNQARHRSTAPEQLERFRTSMDRRVLAEAFFSHLKID